MSGSGSYGFEGEPAQLSTALASQYWSREIRHKAFERGSHQPEPRARISRSPPNKVIARFPGRRQNQDLGVTGMGTQPLPGGPQTRFRVAGGDYPGFSTRKHSRATVIHYGPVRHRNTTLCNGP